ncbi:MAG: flagellar basal body protein FliL [Alphaproteobacteria bacterium]|nr:flagellar basal body protein FliL [Alphaproteobacteria bacterium]
MADDKEKDDAEESGAAEGDILEEGGEKKSKKKLLLIVIPIILLLGGGAGLYFSGLLDGLFGKKADTEEVAEGEHAAEDAHGKEAKGGHDEKKDGGHGSSKAAKGGEGHGETAAAGEHGAADPNAIAFLEMPDIIVNLNNDSGKPQFLRLSVQLEMANQADLEAVQAIMPRVVDQFQTYLRELRVQDIRGSRGMYRLQQELLTRVNHAAAPVEVKDVLFQEILIQ